MPKKIVFSEAAYYDIDSIFAYISRDNKDAAERLRSDITALLNNYSKVSLNNLYLLDIIPY